MFFFSIIIISNIYLFEKDQVFRKTKAFLKIIRLQFIAYFTPCKEW